MATTAAKGVKARGLGVVLALLGAFLLAGAAEASRYLPELREPRPSGLTAELAAGREVEPEAPRLRLDAERFLSLAALSEVGAADTAGALPRFRLHALEAVCTPKPGRRSAYRRFFEPCERIYMEACDLGWKPRQGEYFLQPDPLGPVDSPNLYQAFGYDAFNVTDPWGRNEVSPVPAHCIENPGFPWTDCPGADGANQGGSTSELPPSTVADTIAPVSRPLPGLVVGPCNFDDLPSFVNYAGKEFAEAGKQAMLCPQMKEFLETTQDPNASTSEKAMARAGVGLVAAHDALVVGSFFVGDKAGTTTHPGAGGGARFGTSASTDYKATFFEANPGLRGEVVVHHGVEQQALKRFPGTVTESEIHSLENLRGVPKNVNAEVHLSQIRREWNQFYRQTPNPTKEQLLAKATEIDRKYGAQFNPPVAD